MTTPPGESEKNVLSLYSAYKNSRKNSEPSSNQVKMVNRDSANLDDVALDERQTRAVKLYQSYQQQRIDQRETNIQDIVTFAENWHAQQQAVNNAQHTESISLSVSSIVRAFGEKFSKWVSTFSAPQWQAAAAAVVLGAAIVIVFQIDSDKSSDYLSQLTPQQSQLVAANKTVAQNIQINFSNPFGFTQTQQPHQIAFRFGVLSTDLLVLGQSANTDKFQMMIKELNSLTNLSKQEKIGLAFASLQKLIRTTKQESEGSSAVENAVNQFMQQLDNVMLSSSHSNEYNFGQWIEFTLLATYLPENLRYDTLSGFLSDYNQKQFVKQLSKEQNPSTIKIVSDLDGVVIDTQNASSKTREIYDKQLRDLREKLIQVKAVL